MCIWRRSGVYGGMSVFWDENGGKIPLSPPYVVHTNYMKNECDNDVLGWRRCHHRLRRQKLCRGPPRGPHKSPGKPPEGGNVDSPFVIVVWGAPIGLPLFVLVFWEAPLSSPLVYRAREAPSGLPPLY